MFGVIAQAARCRTDRSPFDRFLRNECGATAIEYALIAALASFAAYELAMSLTQSAASLRTKVQSGFLTEQEQPDDAVKELDAD